MPTIEARGPGAIDRARQMIWEKGVDVYKTRRAPQYVFKAKMRGQGDKAIDILIGDSQSKEFPVGTRVFHRQTGDVGIVTGSGQSTGLFKERLLLVRTGIGRDQVITPKKKEVDLLSTARTTALTEFKVRAPARKTTSKKTTTRKRAPQTIDALVARIATLEGRKKKRKTSSGFFKLRRR